MVVQSRPGVPAANVGPLVSRSGQRIARLRGAAPFVMLVILSLAIGGVNHLFFTWTNIANIADASGVPLIVAAGMTFVILTGSIDLSLEGTVALTAVVTSLLVSNTRTHNDVGWWAAPVALCIGLGIGVLNGVLHAQLRLPSFMVTLGMWFCALGLAYTLYGGELVTIRDAAMRQIGTARVLGGVPTVALIGLFVIGLCYFIQRWTPLGRYAYAIGGDERLAANAGIPVKRYKIIIFAIAGILAALGGFLAALKLGVGSGNIGRGSLFETVAAVVVGGTAITGGVGGMINTLIGVVFMRVLANGLILLHIDPIVQMAVQGVVLIVAVTITFDRSKVRVLK